MTDADWQQLLDQDPADPQRRLEYADWLEEHGLCPVCDGRGVVTLCWSRRYDRPVMTGCRHCSDGTLDRRVEAEVQRWMALHGRHPGRNLPAWRLGHGAPIGLWWWISRCQIGGYGPDTLESDIRAHLDGGAKHMHGTHVLGRGYPTRAEAEADLVRAWCAAKAAGRRHAVPAASAGG